MTAATDLWIALGYILAGAWKLRRAIFYTNADLAAMGNDDAWWVR